MRELSHTSHPFEVEWRSRKRRAHSSVKEMRITVAFFRALRLGGDYVLYYLKNFFKVYEARFRFRHITPDVIKRL